jgi:hypothetical protein
MLLPPEQANRFYRIWWPLLRFVDEQRHVLNDLVDSATEGTLPLQTAFKLRQVLWADDTLLQAFVTHNPASLPPADLDIVASWQQRVAGMFIIYRHLKKHTIFLDTSAPVRAYGVLGLLSPLEEVVGPYLPIAVDAVLLPFEDVIIYDGLIAPYNVAFGSGMRADFDLQYRDAKEREGIVTSLRAEDSSVDQRRQSMEARNAKLLTAFRKDLYKAGLSPATVERHVANVESFASNYLAVQQPPRLLLDLRADDLTTYLDSTTSSPRQAQSLITSFKRLLRFLEDSWRIDPDQAWELRNTLNLYRRQTE